MNKSVYFVCTFCGHPQHTTTFGECEECGRRDLQPVSKRRYEQMSEGEIHKE